ncbi:MAG: DNA methylase [Chloroflexi bacterium]|nr:DNA methylase [Chloroflexota bacterium]
MTAARRRRVEQAADLGSYSDLDLRQWKSYDDLILGSLWLLGPRDKSGPHVGDYWGNFVPQIPQQLMRRFTKRGQVVLDLFAGMSTTLIECRRLGRRGIGVELAADVAEAARARIAQAANAHGMATRLILADATASETEALLRTALAELGRDAVDLAILHPPYHDIIRFSDDPRDLSNAPTTDAFLAALRRAATLAIALLRPGRFLALVIGDTYRAGEWQPLGFEAMHVCRALGLQLKAINVKSIQGNERGKGKRENLWKYRALKEGFYLFKHEYVMLFRKPRG